MTRVISGALGGRRIEVPAGRDTRPTSDRVREALFSRLSHQGVLDGTAVLDLYAGSGALGLEAVSRGARQVLFVESGRVAAEALRRNVAELLPSAGAPTGTSTGPADVLAGVLAGVRVRVAAEPVERLLLRGPERGFDLVLADPPYGLSEDDLAVALALLVNHGWLAPDGLAVVERSARSPEPRWPAGLSSDDERRYGETRVWWARRDAAPVVA